MDGRRPPGPRRRHGRLAPLPRPATQAGLTLPRFRRTVAFAAALAAGLGLAWLDTRPGFDDTGVLVGLLILSGIGVVILAGASSVGLAWVLGVLVGGPTPIVEVINGGQAASVVALVFALAATLITSFVIRVLGRDA